jgi:hypothetical protein
VTTSLPVLVEMSGQEIVGIATDLGLGGMFVRSTETVAYGAEMNVRLELPDVNLKLRLPGIVRWVTELGFGVQFGVFGARETHALVQFVSSARTP